MAGQYSLKTFIRQVRGWMLNRCLKRHSIQLDLDREIIKPAVVEELYQRLLTLPPEYLRRVEADFAAITDLAYGRGTDAIIHEARRQGLDLTTMFLYCRNGYERACWTFLNHSSVFALAQCFVEMDRFGSGRWNRRFVGAGLIPDTAERSLAHLAMQMRRSYSSEGRGRHCHIDHYVREDPLRHCFFAFPEDHARTDLGYSDDGKLNRHARKAAFEVIFVYRPDEGMLEVLAPGGRERVDDVAACFCTIILGLPDLPPHIVPKLYDLATLKSPDLSFPTDPDDGIDSVQLREVKLSVPRDSGWKRRIIFEVDPKALGRASIHDMILKTINQDSAGMDELLVTHARFSLVFAPVDNERPKRLTFEVGWPDRCTLRDNYHDHIARKYLRRWGLVIDADTAKTPSRSRSAV